MLFIPPLLLPHVLYVSGLKTHVKNPLMNISGLYFSLIIFGYQKKG